MNYPLKKNTKIQFKSTEQLPLKELTGTIVGKSTIDQPVIGAAYIIKLDYPELMRSEEYDYDYLTAFEYQFDVIEN